MNLNFNITTITSNKRLNLFIQNKEQPQEISKHNTKGRIVNLRFDGKTNNNQIDITFDRRDGMDFQDFQTLLPIPNGILENIQMFDSSGSGFRTILFLDKKVDKNINALYSYLNEIIDMSINSEFEKLELQ